MRADIYFRNKYIGGLFYEKGKLKGTGNIKALKFLISKTKGQIEDTNYLDMLPKLLENTPFKAIPVKAHLGNTPIAFVSDIYLAPHKFM